MNKLAGGMAAALAVVAMVLPGGAAKVSGAPSELTFKVVYVGGGSWSRGADRTIGMGNCRIRSQSTERSAFHWQVTWEAITVHLTGNAADRISTPSGKLEITYDGSYDETASNCPPPPPEIPHCTKRNDEHVADESEFGYLLAGFDLQAQAFHFVADADAAPEGEPGCPTAAGDGGQQHFMYLANYAGGRHRNLVSPLQAAGTVPLADALQFKKIMISVESTMNPPGPSMNCSLGIPGLNCVEGQSWKGRLEITRVK
jgi:hypothetical protein